jgi:hypothetical protein
LGLVPAARPSAALDENSRQAIATISGLKSVSMHDLKAEARFYKTAGDHLTLRQRYSGKHAQRLLATRTDERYFLSVSSMAAGLADNTTRPATILEVSNSFRSTYEA